MNLEFIEIKKNNAKELANWISLETWPFFSNQKSTPEEVLERIAKGQYFSDGSINFWVVYSNQKIGLIEVFDMEDQNPWFSLRFISNFRGKGFGENAIRWMNDYIFTKDPSIERIEARTREDNLPMRKLLNKCGYRKEGYFRRALVNEDGIRVASIGYGITRQDFISGKTTPVLWKEDKFFNGDIF
jgi:RimJ/RimL family protein N-acetyltransferase